MRRAPDATSTNPCVEHSTDHSKSDSATHFDQFGFLTEYDLAVFHPRRTRSLATLANMYEYCRLT